MANRTTVKSNIQTLNVPSVSNADLEDMLNDNICDNVVFKEDVAVIQNSSSSNINCDFTGKDRINLTRTGGSLIITVSGIEDGQTAWLLVTKTAGQVISWVGVTDITPVIDNVTAQGTVIYMIVRKGNNYRALALIKSPLNASETVRGLAQTATQAQANALSSDLVYLTPAKLPTAGSAQKGLVELATNAETAQGIDATRAVTPAGLTYAMAIQDAWENLTLNTSYFSGATSGYHLKAFVDNEGFVHIWGQNIRISGTLTDPATWYAMVISMPSAYRPTSGDTVYHAGVNINVTSGANFKACALRVNTGLDLAGLALHTTNDLINFYIKYRK